METHFCVVSQPAPSEFVCSLDHAVLAQKQIFADLKRVFSSKLDTSNEWTSLRSAPVAIAVTGSHLICVSQNTV